ncbi:MAG TPA: hypothetical protein VEF90_17790 [Xanthobacteraceae bacterium]|nr:hypothetical protein [Xanthobacteraceae bacterium]
MTEDHDKGGYWPSVGEWVKVTPRGARIWSKMKVGMIGRVVARHKSEGGVSVLFPYWRKGHKDNFGGSHSSYWNLFEGEYEASESYRYRVGDWVTQNGISGQAPAFAGRVAEVGESGLGYALVSVQFDGWTDGHDGLSCVRGREIRSRWNFQHEDLSPADAPRKWGDRFKAGDVLVATESSNRVRKGETVTVVRCEGDGAPLVSLFDGETIFVNDDYFELAPAQFKIGDKVTARAGCDDRLHVVGGDAVGTVRRIDGKDIAVEFEGWTDGHSAGMGDKAYSRWWFGEEDLRAAPVVEETYIVVSDKGAAARPFKHGGRDSAETEAKRLAEKEPGIGFTVYQAVSLAKAEKPPAPPKPIAMLTRLAA